MNPVASVRRARRAPAALLPSRLALPLILTLALVLSLPAPAGGAATSAPRDYDIAFEITISAQDTYAMRMVFADRADTPLITEQDCSVETMLSRGAMMPDGQADFTEKDGERICTITGSEPISQTNGLITHEGEEYVVDTTGLSGTRGVEMSLSITFPGRVTEAGGGEVSGRTVSFDSLTGHVVRGEDSPRNTFWKWGAAVVVGLGLVGAVVAVFLLRRRPAAAAIAAHWQGAGEPGWGPRQGTPAEAGRLPGQAALQALPVPDAPRLNQQPLGQAAQGPQPWPSAPQPHLPAGPGSIQSHEVRAQPLDPAGAQQAPQPQQPLPPPALPQHPYSTPGFQQ